MSKLDDFIAELYRSINIYDNTNIDANDLLSLAEAIRSDLEDIKPSVG